MHDQLYVHFVTFSVFRRRTLLNHEHAKLILLRWLNEVLDRWQALWQDCVCRVPLDGTSGIDPWDCRSIVFRNSTSFGCATPVGSKQPTGATPRTRRVRRNLSPATQPPDPRATSGYSTGRSRTSTEPHRRYWRSQDALRAPMLTIYHRRRLLGKENQKKRKRRGVEHNN